MNRLLLDLRSASLKRTTGWERYTRNLGVATSGLPGIVRYSAGTHSIVGRMWSDNVGVPMALRKSTGAYFPTFPPSVAVRGSAPVIMTIHDLTWWRFPETASRLGLVYYRQLADYWMSRAACIVTVSKTVAAELSGMTRQPVRVVENVVSIDQVKSQRFAAAERPYFLTVGSLEPRKNLIRLAEAFRLSGVSSEFDLVIVGRRAWGEVPHGVRIVSGLSDGQLRYAYEHAQACFFASIYEGFGLPVAEAAALGVPVFCSRIPVFDEVAGSENRRSFGVSDLEEMVDAFRDAAQMTSREFAPVNPYSPERMRESFCSVVQEFT